MIDKFQGSIVALVTPMKASGAVDWPALDALVDWHVESGTNGIVAVGTTGESATLEVDEHLEVISRCVQRARGALPIIAGTGANSTSEAVHLSKQAEGLGADALLQVTPYYNKPTQSGLRAHFEAVAEAVTLPIILYNVPGRTACDLLPETIARLSGHPRVVGVKEASGDVVRCRQILAACGDGFTVLSGEDELTAQMFALGAVGVISVTANIAPSLMARLCGAHARGDSAEVQRIDAHLQPIHAAMFVESNPIPVKWALHCMGRIEVGIRLPLQVLSEANRGILESLLDGIVSEEGL